MLDKLKFKGVNELSKDYIKTNIKVTLLQREEIKKLASEKKYTDDFKIETTMNLTDFIMFCIALTINNSEVPVMENNFNYIDDGNKKNITLSLRLNLVYYEEINNLIKSKYYINIKGEKKKFTFAKFVLYSVESYTKNLK